MWFSGWLFVLVGGVAVVLRWKWSGRPARAAAAAAGRPVSAGLDAVRGAQTGDGAGTHILRPTAATHHATGRTIPPPIIPRY